MSGIAIKSPGKECSRLLFGATGLIAVFTIWLAISTGSALTGTQEIHADPDLSTAFVKWWLSGALDYTSSRAGLAHESAAKWVCEPEVGSFERTFWSDGKGVSEQIVFVPDLFWSPVYVDSRTVGLQVSGNFISLADPSMQSRYVRFDFKVRTDPEGLRISSWDLVYEPDRKDLIEFLSRKPAGVTDIGLNRKALSYFCSAFERKQKHDMMGALWAYSKSIQLNPKFALAYLDRGRVCHALKVKSNALQDFSKAVELGPELWTAYFNRAMVRSDLGDRDGSNSDYDEVVRLVPNCPYAYANRAVEMEGRGDLNRALADLDRAVFLSRTEDKAFCLYQRATSFSWSGSILTALFDCNESIRLSPGFAPTYRLRGEIRRKLHDQSGAHQDLRIAQSLENGRPPGR